MGSPKCTGNDLASLQMAGPKKNIMYTDKTHMDLTRTTHLAVRAGEVAEIVC